MIEYLQKKKIQNLFKLYLNQQNLQLSLKLKQPVYLKSETSSRSILDKFSDTKSSKGEQNFWISNFIGFKNPLKKVLDLLWTDNQ